MRRAEKTGRIAREVDGAWDLERVRAAWAGNTDPAQQRGGSGATERSGNRARSAVKPVPEAALGAVRDTLREHGEPVAAGAMTFMQARTANEVLKARSVGPLQRMKGELVDPGQGRGAGVPAGPRRARRLGQLAGSGGGSASTRRLAGARPAPRRGSRARWWRSRGATRTPRCCSRCLAPTPAASDAGCECGRSVRRSPRVSCTVGSNWSGRPRRRSARVRAIRQAPATSRSTARSTWQLTAERLVTPDRQGLPARLVGEGAGPAQRGTRLPGLCPSRGGDLWPRSVRGAPLAADGRGAVTDGGAG